MLYLDFNTSLQTQQYLGELEVARAELDPYALLPHEYTVELRRHVLAQSIHYSTRIEGNRLTLQQVESVLGGERVSAAPDQVQEVLNYKEALEYVEVFVAGGNSLTEDTVRTLHYLVAKSLPGDFAPGRFRTEQNYVVDRVTDRTVFAPPPPEFVAGLISELLSWLNGHPEVPPPIRAAIAHLNIAAIHPFNDGNGRTARVLDALVLYTSGYKSQRLVSLEAYFGRDNRGYYEAIASSLGRVFRPPRDISAWLEYYLKAHVVQVREALPSVKWIERLFEGFEKRFEGLGLRTQQLAAVIMACLGGRVTNRDLRGLLGRSHQSAVSDLAKLQEVGLLRRIGAGRSTAYIPSELALLVYGDLRRQRDEDLA